jgi:hypothetical protein
MELTQGELVTVADGGANANGIVFDTPSPGKVVVAMMDPVRGPRFRTVNVKTLSERAQEDPADHGLRLLIRRTPQPARGGARGNARGEAGREGFRRGAAHRSTGK